MTNTINQNNLKEKNKKEINSQEIIDGIKEDTSGEILKIKDFGSINLKVLSLIFGGNINPADEIEKLKRYRTTDDYGKKEAV